MDTTPEVAAQVVALIEAGQNQSQVARQLNISRYSVRRVYQRHRETGSFSRRRGSGRSRATTRRDNRFLITTALRNRRLSAVDLGQRLREVREVGISRWTVRRRLAEGGLTSRRPATGPKLTPAHRQARLRFAQNDLDWSLEQWGAVLFSDEPRWVSMLHHRASRIRRWIVYVLGRNFSGCKDRTCLHHREEHWPSIKRIDFSPVY